MHKRVKSKILFIFLPLLAVYGSSVAKSRDLEKIEVILEPVRITGTAAPIENDDFMESLSNHIRYYLFYKGFDCEIVSNTVTSPDVQGTVGDYSRVISIKPEFEFTNKQMIIEDKKRRKKFTTVDGYLTCRLSYKWLKVKDADSIQVRDGMMMEHSDLDWFEFDHDPVSSQLITFLRSKPEPKEYVLQRAVERLFHDLPKTSHMKTLGDNLISSMLFIDSSFIKHARTNWENKLNLLMAVASNSLNKQFGYGLHIGKTDLISLTSEDDFSMLHLFRSLKRHHLKIDERISVFLLNKNNRVDYFASTTYDNIGLAEIGRKQIILNELPSPKKNETVWQSFYNSLTLIHEIGHTFGAIHVSDKNSIMNHTTNWIASDRFDPFNKQIVIDALQGNLRFDNKLAYLTYVGNLLLQSDYHLVDFPPFFYSFFKEKSDSALFNAFKANKSFKPIILAVSGYGYLQNGFHKNAEADLRKAIQLLPNQASLYYYLSQCLTGKDAKEAMRKAEQLGYYAAALKDKNRQ